MNNALSISPSDVPMPRKISKGEGDSDDANRGELNSINIELTENGCIVRCSFDPLKLDPKMDRYSQMPEDEKYSFDDMDKAGAYVMGMLKGQADYEEAEDSSTGKKTKAPKGGKKAADASEE